MMITRASYQDKRFSLLKSLIDVKNSVGLEIGACDLPTVKGYEGNCHYADFRSADEMAKMWQIPRSDFCDVEYIIARNNEISECINDRFDYIIACHVIEHVPDPINYINQLKLLLKPGPGRIIFLAVPEKRETSDRTRPSTTIDHILMDYACRSKSPSLEHILEFHRHWMASEPGVGVVAINEAYRYATEYLESDQPDAHCHVWTDFEFSNVCRELVNSGFLPGLSLIKFQPTLPGFNEFVAVFST